MNTYVEYAFIAVAGVLAVTLHEAAHGYAAWALGDDTAKRLGRLSLNPLVHVDRVGTFIFPGFLIAIQLATVGHVGLIFGWAKPVPVAAWKFANPRRGMMVVAAAGPGMNFLLAWLTLIASQAEPVMPHAFAGPAILFVLYFVLMNLGLGLFNLLPILPLDGGRIVAGLLPEAAAQSWAKLEKAGLLVVLVVLFLLPAALQDLFGIEFSVTQWVFAAARPVFNVLMTLAGEPSVGRLIGAEIFGG